MRITERTASSGTVSALPSAATRALNVAALPSRSGAVVTSRALAAAAVTSSLQRIGSRAKTSARGVRRSSPRRQSVSNHRVTSSEKSRWRGVCGSPKRMLSTRSARSPPRRRR
ncbi:MAG: hypothetical protein IPF99_18170 [Deltaproteobacteria bacterium]|nr:hypothetical protein [Deltaproteobacteria bacterium]